MSKLSNENSRLQQEFYGSEVGGKGNKQSPHKSPRAQQPIYGAQSDHKDKL